MEIHKVPINTLTSPDWNPRQITEEELTKLETSLKEFGYIEPIIVNDVNNHIVGGNQRCKALRQLGYEEVDVVYVHIEDLAKEKACNVALNKISGDWDNDKLKVVLEEIELSSIDISLTGFDDIELTDMEINEPVSVHEDGYEIEDEEGITVNVKTGDLYQLGNHRLLCGDSTVEENVKKLMNGTKAKILFTSPPYSDMRDYHTNEENLDLSNIIKFIQTFKPYTDYQVINLGIQYKDKEVNCYWDKYIEFAKNIGYKLLSWNVWNRGMSGGIGQQMRMFALYHEWVFVFGTEPYDLNKTVPKKEENINNNTPRSQREKDGSLKYHDAGDTSNPYKKMGTVLDMIYFTGSIDHPAVFPIGLPSEYIRAMTGEGDAVIDCFGGSGTTMIACEQLHRQCYMMELDPYYCQVIINRWEQYTGEKATKIN